jgi:acetoin utilization protein AcuB
MLCAHDLMTEDPTTISMTASVHQAVRLLQTLDVRHLPVVDEEGTLLGMLSDRDVRGLGFPEAAGGEDPTTILTALDAPVASIMSSDVVSVDVDADAAEVIDSMLDRKVGAVPVVDADGTLVGIVSYMDVLRELSMEDKGPAERGVTNGASR